MTQPNGTLQTTPSTVNLNDAAGSALAAQVNGNTELAAVLARLAKLEEQNAALKAQVAQAKPAPKALSIAVSEKKAVMVRGLQRWPVTLYKSQWERLLEPEFVAKLKQFLKDNDSLLAKKDDVSGTEE
jgi:hypothetical protein